MGVGINDNLIEDYRTVITNCLLNSPEIVEILSNGELDTESSDELLWNKIFPTQFIQGTVTDTETYIFYDIEENANSLTTYTDGTVIFWVVAHKSLLQYKHKLRLDVLSRKLKDIMRKSCKLGMSKNHFLYNRLLNGLPDDYTGRIVVFKVTDWCDKIRSGDVYCD